MTKALQKIAAKKTKFQLSPVEPVRLLAVGEVYETAKRFELIGNLDEAIFLGRQIAEASPAFLPGLITLAAQLVKANQYREAVSVADRVLEQKQRRPSDFVNLARIYRECRRFDKASFALTLARKLFPASTAVLCEMALQYQLLNDSARAEALLRMALKINPKLMAAYSNLARVRAESLDAAEVDYLVGQMESATQNAATRSAIGFALAAIYRSKGQFDAESGYLARANDLRPERSSWDAASEAQARAELRKAFHGPQAKVDGETSLQALVIAGMPRSGTTLLEQIIGRHSRVTTTGESAVLFGALRDAARQVWGSPRYWQHWAGFDESRFRQVARSQALARLNAAVDMGTECFTDKTMGNDIDVGAILSVWPNAKILYIKRNPLDTVISCYQHAFAHGNGFVYDLEACARKYQMVEGMMEFWMERYPGSILRVGYEQLVGDFEAQCRAILAFLGLPFEPGCLRFYESDDVVLTASSSQVREPVHRGSIGKSRHYVELLAPAAKVFNCV